MESGNYGTDGELIREAIREKRTRMAEVEAISAQLVEGEKSGGNRLDPAELIEAVIDKRRRDGNARPSKCVIANLSIVSSISCTPSYHMPGI